MAGKYESRPCSPPNVIQVCTVCSTCPAGSYIRQACSAKSNTICERCTSSICTSDNYNAQFGPPNGCTGTEYHDTAQCGAITESYGQPCAPNTYKKQSRIPLPASLNVSGTLSYPMAYDVAPDRGVYAYGFGSTITIYEYVSSSSNASATATCILPNPLLVISDIRFSTDSASIFATVQSSDATYRCNVRCPLGVYALNSENKKVCQQPESSVVVQCTLWVPDTFNALVPDSGRYVKGGCQLFADGYSRMICAFGTTYRASTIESVVTEWSSSRNRVYTFDPNIEVIGPPAYNKATRTMFVFVSTNTTNIPFAIYRFVLDDTTSVLKSWSIFYTHVQPGTSSMRSSFVGASIRLDTNMLVAADEVFRRIYVFQLQGLTSTTGPAFFNTSYSANYMDLEFVGGIGKPSKLFFAVQEEGGGNTSSNKNLWAELYVQCAPCQDGSITSTARPAESQSDCFCRPGFYTTPDGGCKSCQCSSGEYQSGYQRCETGRETSKVSCSVCGASCGDGQFLQGTCDGSSASNNISCATCKNPAIAAAGTNKCSAVLAASNFEQPCLAKDCVRRQALLYPFDGWDITRDLAPRGRRLVPISASSRSAGPTVTLENAKTGGVAAAFNASNHEYFQIPRVSLFDRQLGYRIVQNSSIYEVGMTLAFWVRFTSSAGGSQSLFELSNGISTENIYVRRVGSTAELLFGVSHTLSSVCREYATANGTLAFGESSWQHIAWTILPSGADNDALWNIYIDAGDSAAYTNLSGVMPIDGTYSTNFIGFGTSMQQQMSFFTGAMDDLRLYERALTLQSIRAIYRMDPCCHAASGGFIDMTKPCTGLEKYDPHFCQPCRTDCGPMQYISNFESRCDGSSTSQDTTTCLPCSACTLDQYIGKICSGTTMFDEQLCPACRCTLSFPSPYNVTL